jgi:hypothetical protein
MSPWWIIGFGMAGLVVVIVAVLLLAILWQALRIRRLARAAIGIVTEIESNTRSVWALTKTNATAAGLLEGARAIESNTTAILQAAAGDHRDTSAA